MLNWTTQLHPSFATNTAAGGSPISAKALRRLKTIAGVNQRRGRSVLRGPLLMLLAGGSAVAATMFVVWARIHFARG